MNIADGIINLIIFFFQNVLLKLLPVNMPGVPYRDFSSLIDSLHNLIATPVYFFNAFFPFDTLLILIGALISLELILWFIRLGMTGWNMIRGSGAKV